MAKKQGKQNQKRIVVSIRHVATPDAEERFSHAIGILLKAATRNTSQSKQTPNTKKKEPPCQAPADDALTRGSGGNDSHGEG